MRIVVVPIGSPLRITAKFRIVAAGSVTASAENAIAGATMRAPKPENSARIQISVCNGRSKADEWGIFVFER